LKVRNHSLIAIVFTYHCKKPNKWSNANRAFAEVRKIAEPYLVGGSKVTSKKRSPIAALMGVYGSLESWVTRWRLSGLNFRSKKIMLIWDAERPPQTKFQLPNMFCSREIKSRKLPIICVGDKF
jgi:hypothetical protein